MANTYEKGDLVRVTGTWTDTDGSAVDPSAVFTSYTDPSNVQVDLEYGVDAALKKSGTGIYYVDVDADETGTWYYRFYSTGTGQAANETFFDVRPSEF
jgi:hypothetical protein